MACARALWQEGTSKFKKKEKAMGERGQVKELLEKLVEPCRALLSGFVFILSPKSNRKTLKVR